MKVAIIGGGIAGLTTAWLIAKEHEVTVFEARSHPGGHAHSLAIEDNDVRVDFGAQYISPDGFPKHGRVLRALGIDRDRLAPAPVTLTVTRAGDRAPLLVSPHAPHLWRTPMTGDAWEALSTFLAEAAAFQAADGDWTIPLADLVEPLPVAREFKDGLLYPLFAYITCCANQEIPGVSARAAIDFFLGLAPAAPDQAPIWANPIDGMQEIANRLAATLPAEAVQLNTGITMIQRHGEYFVLTDVRGNGWSVDRIVLATSAEAAVPILAPLAGTQHVRLQLARFPYSRAVIAIHRDQLYMPARREHWSVVNLEIHDGWTEATNWYGPIHGRDVFKSWITYRAEPPSELMGLRDFRHLVVTPAAVRARQELSRCQGQGGIYLVGSYLHGIDSQESAVTSAIAVAHQLTPQSARLKEIQ